jgi:hypothetical protein
VACAIGRRSELKVIAEAGRDVGHADPGTTKLYDPRGYNPLKSAAFFATTDAAGMSCRVMPIASYFIHDTDKPAGNGKNRSQGGRDGREQKHYQGFYEGCIMIITVVFALDFIHNESQDRTRADSNGDKRSEAGHISAKYQRVNPE